jgi:cell division septation protein DedD
VLKSPDLTPHTQDDAFREIQLNGKQLVFLFMVATVFSVVIFLCGVFVGRGVRAERPGLLADATGSSPVTTPDVVASAGPAPPPAGSDPTAAAPPPAVDELSYFNRLDKSSAAKEELKAPAPAALDKEPPRKDPPKKEAPNQAPPTREPSNKEPSTQEPTVAGTKPPPTSLPASAVEPTGPGFALQITALREKGEAETIARRLSSKGYSAYVLTPAKGAPPVYRVRIGKFKTRREAEAMATRLQKEEQFKPWITR